MPGMFNIIANAYSDLSDRERSYTVNAGLVVCAYVYGPRMCYPGNAHDGEMCYSVCVIMMHDINLFVGKFQTIEEAEEKHAEIIHILDLAFQRGS